MKSLLTIIILTSLFGTLLLPAHADPKTDLKAYHDFFKKKFPDLTFIDLSNGMYNFNPVKREQWEEIMDFPTYEIAIDNGQVLFTTPFKNGKT